jgi:ubiquinone/menaquinone biosynthesis C-methylase UbiE
MSVLAAIVALALVTTIAWRRRRPAPFPARLGFLLDIPVPGLRHAPSHLVRRLALEPTMHVLEIGPGSGFYTRSLVDSGLSSRLICLDVQPAMLQKLRNRFGAHALSAVCADASALPFRAGSFDRILMVTVLGEIPDRGAALRECARLLSEHGMLVVAESVVDPDYVPAGTLVREARHAGLAAVDRSGPWISYTQRLARSALPPALPP